MSESLLKIQVVDAYYGLSQILHKVSLQIFKDECLVILGRNGMGKTTLLRSIMGLTPPRKHGDIYFGEENISLHSPFNIAKLGIGYVPQGRRLFPSLSVEEHLRLTHQSRGGDHKWTPEEIYELFPSLSERRKLSGASLSGGEQQMLAIGRALVTNPLMLVMDEPTEGLAPNIKQKFVNITTTLVKEGSTLLVTEQDLAIGIEIAHRVSILVTGEVIEILSAKRFKDNKDLQRRYLGVD